MSVIRRLRTVGSLAVVVVGVPMLMVGNASHGSAGLTPTGAALGSTTSNLNGTTSTGTGAGSASTSGTAGTTSGTTSTTNLPADKMTVAAGDVDVAGPNADVVVMQGTMRTSSPADLLLQVTSECSIVTQVETKGNDTQTASGQIRMWITIDGTPVQVVSGPSAAPTDDGKVVFCNRVYSSTTSGFVADPNADIKTYESTKSANAFNWVSFNVGNGVHVIQVHAELSVPVADTSNASSEMVVGERTLVVNTTETAQNQAG